MSTTSVDFIGNPFGFRHNQADIRGKAMTAKPTIYRWRIIHLKGTPAKTIGYVDAPDAEAAIAKAIEEFKIEPAIRGRIVAERQR